MVSLSLAHQDASVAVQPARFECLRSGHLLFITLPAGCGSLPDREFTAAVTDVLRSFDSGVTMVVVDLHHLTSCSSDRLLGPLVVFWNRVRKQHGRMAVHGLYRYGREVLHRTRLDQLWPVCDTRETAIEAVSKTSPPTACGNLQATLDWIVFPGS